MSSSENETQRGEDSLEQVREILFGQAKRTHDNQVHQLEEEVEALRRALDQERGAREARESALAAGTAELRGELERQTEELRATLGDLSAHLENSKVDRVRLAGWFDELARRLREGDS